MKLSIPDMSCGHCRAMVEKAIRGVDAGAAVEVDLADRTVQVQSRAAAADLLAALTREGYPAEVLG
jgi:copper chaperone